MPTVPLLGQNQPAVTNEEKPIEYTTAFLVLVGKDGTFELETDINRAITTDRLPTSHEIKGSLASIVSDMAAQEAAMLSAQLTIGNLMAQAQRMQEMQANAQLMQKVKL